MKELNPNCPSPSVVINQGFIYILPNTMRFGSKLAESMCEKLNIIPSKNKKGNIYLNVKFATQKGSLYIKVVKEPTDKTVAFTIHPTNSQLTSCKIAFQAFLLDFFKCKEKAVLQIDLAEKLTNGCVKCVLDTTNSK